MIVSTKIMTRWHCVLYGYIKRNTLIVMLSPNTFPVPIPGGCNMEFPLKLDPNLHVTYKQTVNLVQFQYAQQGRPTSINCDVQLHRSLQYAVYQDHIDSGENNTFRAIEGMLRTEAIKKTGKKVGSFVPITA